VRTHPGAVKQKRRVGRDSGARREEFSGKGEESGRRKKGLGEGEEGAEIIGTGKEEERDDFLGFLGNVGEKETLSPRGGKGVSSKKRGERIGKERKT